MESHVASSHLSRQPLLVDVFCNRAPGQFHQQEVGGSRQDHDHAGRQRKRQSPGLLRLASQERQGKNTSAPGRKPSTPTAATSTPNHPALRHDPSAVAAAIDSVAAGNIAYRDLRDEWPRARLPRVPRQEEPHGLGDSLPVQFGPGRISMQKIVTLFLVMQ